MVVPPLILDEVFFFGKGSNGLCDMSLYLRLSKKVFENFEYPCSKSWARPCSAPRSRLRSRLRLVSQCCGVSAAPWWHVSKSVLLGRMLVSPWWRRWLRPCGGSPATPWWWSGEAGRLFTAVIMRVKTHPSLGRRRWSHWRHFLPEGDVVHLWLGHCSCLWTWCKHLGPQGMFR